MLIKPNKKLILPSALLIVSVIFYLLYLSVWNEIYMVLFTSSSYQAHSNYIIFYSIVAIMSALYCIFSDQKISKIFYYIGFGSFALFNLYCLDTIVQHYGTGLGGNSSIRYEVKLYHLISMALIVISILMILTKVINIGRGLKIVGIAVFGIYALLLVLDVINNIKVQGYIWILAQYITQFMGLFLVWRFESYKIKTVNKTVSVPVDTGDVGSTYTLCELKEMYKSGKITEEEYNAKKSEIVNKI